MSEMAESRKRSEANFFSVGVPVSRVTGTDVMIGTGPTHSDKPHVFHALVFLAKHAHQRSSKMDEKQAGPSTPPTWMKRREKVVQRALDDGDLAQLRKISALPGGFGSEEMRRRVW